MSPVTFTLLFSFSILLASISDDTTFAVAEGTGSSINDRQLKTSKKAEKKGKKIRSNNLTTTARCTRKVYSVLDPNPSWTDHPFHTQVWYHTLEDIHSLWSEGYFDYVLDIRPLQDFTIDNGGEDLLLEGWETFHIPGSYPVNMFPPSTPASEVEMLIDFDSSNLCKDARIFVHCWSGISGNMVAKTLIELGFTNIHAAGPQGSAGIWDWKAAGYDIVMNDSFNAEESRFQPSCIDMCEA